MVPFLYPFARNHLLGMSTFFDGLGIKALGDANESSRPFPDNCDRPHSARTRFSPSFRIETHSSRMRDENICFAAAYLVFEGGGDLLAPHFRSELLDQPIPNGLPHVLGDVRISCELKALSIAKITHEEESLLITLQLDLHDISPLFGKCTFRDSKSFQ